MTLQRTTIYCRLRINIFSKVKYSYGSKDRLLRYGLIYYDLFKKTNKVLAPFKKDWIHLA
jgi:hypothetical protein